MKNKPDFEAFTDWALDAFYDNGCLGIDIDVDTLEEKACEFGVMEKVPVTEACGEFCVCAQVMAGDGAPIYCCRRAYLPNPK